MVAPRQHVIWSFAPFPLPYDDQVAIEIEVFDPEASNTIDIHGWRA